MKRKICYVLFVLLVLLNIYDTYSTNTLLNSDMFYEANPIVRVFMNIFGQLASMVVFKGLALIWTASLLLRSRTERMWNILTTGLIVCTCWYAVIMYFMNYQAMLLLGGVS
jgi:hypothetical protein